MAGFLWRSGRGIYRQIRLAVFAVLAYATSVVDVAHDPWTDGARAAGRAAGAVDERPGPFHALPRLGWRAAAARRHLSALLHWLAGERARRRRSRGRCAVAAGVSAAMRPACRLCGARRHRRCGAASLPGCALLALWSVAGPWSFPDALPASLTRDIWARPLPDRPAARRAARRRLGGDGHRRLPRRCLPRNARTHRTPHGPRSGAAHLSAAARRRRPVSCSACSCSFCRRARGRASPRWCSRISSSCCPTCSCRLPTRGKRFDRRYEAVAAGLGEGRLAGSVCGCACRC